MSRLGFSSMIILISISIAITSCSKEELSNDAAEYVYTELTAEDYLSNNSLPAILFSYNVYNPETKLQSSWLIDREGNIRASETESNLVYEGGALSPYYMDAKKEKSTKSYNYVDLEKLVDNYKRLGVINNLEYNRSAETESSQSLSTIYGYYFASTVQDEGCACSSGSESSVQLFEPVLLEQRVGNTLIQTNTQAGGIVTWINSLNVQGK